MQSQSIPPVVKRKNFYGDNLMYGGMVNFCIRNLTSLRKFCSENPVAFLSIVVALIGLAIVARSEGVYVTVVADEYVYSKSSRLVALSDSTFPSYLYLFIYRLTNYCGDEFLSCARLLNVIFYLLAAPFIFSITSRLTARPIALFVAIVAVLAPTNVYTTYFMPESLYFLFFWVFSWSILKRDINSTYMSWVFNASLFSLVTLVKPHALFFLPGLIIYFAYLSRQSPDKPWVPKWLAISTLFTSVALATKIAFGFVFAGQAGVTLFGATYGSIASGAAIDFAHYARLAEATIVSLFGHFLAMSLLFGTVLATVLLSLKKVLSRSQTDNFSLQLTVYALVIFGTLIPVTALFTASIANMGPYETPFRLHLRYYNFAFPLFLMLSAAQVLSPKTPNCRSVGSVLAALPIIVALVYAIATKLRPFVPSLVDNPEIRGLTVNPSAFYLLGTIGLGALICWIRDHRLGNRIFLFVFIPLFVTSSFAFNNRDIRTRLRPDVFDRAGILVHHYLEGTNGSKLVIMGSSSDSASLFRTLFYVDNPRASIIDIPKDTTANISNIPSDTEWLLLFDEQPFSNIGGFKLPFNGFSLYRLAETSQIEFKQGAWQGTISRVSGLSDAESWGRWSDSSLVSLKFVHPLPQKFKLHIVASAFGPNVGRTFVVRIGNQSVNLTLSNQFEERSLLFVNSGQTNSIHISVPEPISPRQLGLSDDARKLGIGLKLLWIESLPE